jgi:RNA polymerase sigma factor (sigma-70 family)
MDESSASLPSAAFLAINEPSPLPHMNAAYNLARWLSRSSQAADDLVQESYLKAFRSFDSFQGKDSNDGRSWLLTIVRNTCFTWLKKKATCQPRNSMNNSTAQPTKTPNTSSSTTPRWVLSTSASKGCRSCFGRRSSCANSKNFLTEKYPTSHECLWER